MADEAFAGDVVGIPNHGTLRIGVSLAMLNALHAAFDQAEKDGAVVILKARGKHFSGGFDLNVFAKGSAEDQYLMLKAGAELALRILSFPTPVVAACQGNAYPMGAFLIMSSDHRIAAEGDYRIGMNEFGSADRAELCAGNRARAADAGLFQQGGDDGGNVRPRGSRHRRFLRPCGRCRTRWSAAPRRPRKSSPRSTWRPMPRTKARARGAVIKMIRGMIDEDITPQYGEDRVARRASA